MDIFISKVSFPTVLEEMTYHVHMTRLEVSSRLMSQCLWEGMVPVKLLQLKSALARPGKRVHLYAATTQATEPIPSAEASAIFFLMFICSLARITAG
jgi:hypothetical protein